MLSKCTQRLFRVCASSRSYAIDHCRAILFDIDGVLVRGKATIPGAKESLRKLQQAKYV
jgi:ribonucleotide monophosphatase NagD (HAD superfamily)